MTSDGPAAPKAGNEDDPAELYVWVWLPGASEPVVAGVLTRTDRVHARQPVLAFTYARSYLARSEAVSLFLPELPLGDDTLDPTRPVFGRSPLSLHGCLRDASPDAWGRRVINLRFAGNPDIELSELTYLANSGSNRVGALDFQHSPRIYGHRGEEATLEQLMRAAELVEAGMTLPEELAAAAGHGTSIGGATPKAVLVDGSRQLIAKFSSTADTRPVVQAEAAAMFLAALVGVRVAPSEVRSVAGRKVLLLDRFDRGLSGQRRLMISGLTILGRHELEARYSSYADLAHAVRTGPWVQVGLTLRQLFLRQVFNVCIGNTDDHLRNHAAFWDGRTLELTPAFDLTPQPRSTQVATHAIGLTSTGERFSQLRLCRAAAAEFQVSPRDADEIIDHVVTTVRSRWRDAADHARLRAADAESLMGREVLNPYIFYEAP